MRSARLVNISYLSYVVGKRPEPSLRNDGLSKKNRALMGAVSIDIAKTNYYAAVEGRALTTLCQRATFVQLSGIPKDTAVAKSMAHCAVMSAIL